MQLRSGPDLVLFRTFSGLLRCLDKTVDDIALGRFIPGVTDYYASRAHRLSLDTSRTIDQHRLDVVVLLQGTLGRAQQAVKAFNLRPHLSYLPKGLASRKLVLGQVCRFAGDTSLL